MRAGQPQRAWERILPEGTDSTVRTQLGRPRVLKAALLLGHRELREGSR